MAMIFSPSAFAAPFQTVVPLDAAMVVAADSVGDWVYCNDRPNNERYEEAVRSFEAAQRRLFEALSDGNIVAYVHLIPDRFYKVPLEYWCGEQFLQARLDGALFGFYDEIPRELLDKPLIILRSDLDRYLKPDTPPVRRGPKHIFDWASFEREAVAKLDYEGDYGPAILPADLVRCMADWCVDNWERTPGPTSLKKHVAMAHDRFLRLRAGH